MIRIKGLTHKMKNRIREHGNEWHVVKQGAMSGDWLITPKPHLLKDEPYMIWVTRGKDIEVLDGEKG